MAYFPLTDRLKCRFHHRLIIFVVYVSRPRISINMFERKYSSLSIWQRTSIAQRRRRSSLLSAQQGRCTHDRYQDCQIKAERSGQLHRPDYYEEMLDARVSKAQRWVKGCESTIGGEKTRGISGIADRQINEDDICKLRIVSITASFTTNGLLTMKTHEENMTRPIIGTIQWMSSREVHAKIKIPHGANAAVNTREAAYALVRRCLGSACKAHI